MLNKKLLGSVSAPPAEFVDDVFSTFLYTGNSSTQTINNGIDLAGKGGLVWVKPRGPSAGNHQLADTVRGTSSQLSSNTTTAAATETNRFTSFNSNGFSLDSSSFVNNSTQTYCSWTFREQAKFFDVVTYTGNGSAPRDIAHSLGSSPGFIIVKRTNSTGDWWCWHRSIANKNIYLNYSDGADSGTNPMISAVSSTNFTLATNQNATMNISGATYVAYLFAHDAGGFGTAGTDNVISCGSFTTDGSGNATINLGYEPQYVMWKASSATGNWFVEDVMRGFNLTSRAILFPNLSNAEATGASAYLSPNATGFSAVNSQLDASTTFIYMAIRRPMKPPTSGTQVFSVTSGNFSTPYTVTTGFPVDLSYSSRTGGSDRHFIDRLRGGTTTSYRYLPTNGTAAEIVGGSAGIGMQSNTSIIDNDFVTGANAVWWNFRRATGFFDVVCYTGNGTAGRTVSHNLTVTPELIIVKNRDSITPWKCYSSYLGGANFTLTLNETVQKENQTTVWNSTDPTASVFTVGTAPTSNDPTKNYVAYLFSTCAGVSKVGSYTGNGTTQTINCGFTTGARFVLIKRTDDADDWHVFDTTRGIVSGNDPYLKLNTTDAEASAYDLIDPDSSGFTINTNFTGFNRTGATYIFLAIA